jgi:YtxH-like protein
MQNVRNIILSVGAAIAGTKIVRAVSDIGVDDVLAPLGLSRRRTHVAQDLALLGAGMVVGGAVALIFAPMSGRETRQRIARKADELSDVAADKLRELRDEVRPRLGNSHVSEAQHT